MQILSKSKLVASILILAAMIFSSHTVFAASKLPKQCGKKSEFLVFVNDWIDEFYPDAPKSEKRLARKTLSFDATRFSDGRWVAFFIKKKKHLFYLEIRCNGKINPVDRVIR